MWLQNTFLRELEMITEIDFGSMKHVLMEWINDSSVKLSVQCSS